MITSCDIYQKINSVQKSKMCDWMLCDDTFLFILCHSLLSLFHSKYRYYYYLFQKNKIFSLRNQCTLQEPHVLSDFYSNSQLQLKLVSSYFQSEKQW